MDVKLGFKHQKQDTVRDFENRMLRRIFGPKRDEVIGGCRKQHNDDLHNCTLSQI
jgi:hypothetical protein